MEQYETPELEIIVFNSADVIVTSNATKGEGDNAFETNSNSTSTASWTS